MTKPEHQVIDPDLLTLDGRLFNGSQLTRRSIDWNVWADGLPANDPVAAADRAPPLEPVDLEPFLLDVPAVSEPAAVPASARHEDAPPPARQEKAPPPARARKLVHPMTAGTTALLALVGLASASQLRGGAVHPAVASSPSKPAETGTEGAAPVAFTAATATAAESPSAAAMAATSGPANQQVRAANADHQTADTTPRNASPFAVSQSAPHGVFDGPSTPQFSRPAAAIAIAALGRAAAGCAASGDVRAVPVRVVFAPSGRVTSASVGGGPLSGTTAGSCIATVLRGARVPAFGGDSVAVATTVRLR